MKFLTVFLASLLAVVAANPIGDIAAREPATLHCDIVPFLSCKGGIDQQLDCQAISWTCPGNGLHPVISNKTCAKQCVCEIPCP
ncbi:hypothetical protein GGX14DRAFT_479451 [Mycena pura]|uniref:Uncharacterized protein n=1 Tax=Mycena pura TaxID=153505 RepID=A0AAD6UYB4_9AGAR|nr:hypothetical protein GGX14DRAFT_479451 [Mycena pura]